MSSDGICTRALAPLDPASAARVLVGGQPISQSVLESYYRACEAAFRVGLGGKSDGDVVQGVGGFFGLVGGGSGSGGGSVGTSQVGVDGDGYVVGGNDDRRGLGLYCYQCRAGFSSGSQTVTPACSERSGVMVSRGAVRGPNYARNCESRKKKKEKRMKERSGVRVGDSAPACDDGALSVKTDGFSQCSGFGVGSFWRGVTPDLAQVLRDTRAERLIAENKRAVVKAKSDVSRLEARDALVSCGEESGGGMMLSRGQVDGKSGVDGKYKRVVGTDRKNRCGGAKTVEKVSGWAKTLVSDGGDVDSVPISSVPSLSTGVSPNSSVSVGSAALVRENKRLKELLDVKMDQSRPYKAVIAVKEDFERLVDEFDEYRRLHS